MNQVPRYIYITIQTGADSIHRSRDLDCCKGPLPERWSSMEDLSSKSPPSKPRRSPESFNEKKPHLLRPVVSSPHPLVQYMEARIGDRGKKPLAWSNSCQMVIGGPLQSHNRPYILNLLNRVIIDYFLCAWPSLSLFIEMPAKRADHSFTRTAWMIEKTITYFGLYFSANWPSSQVSREHSFYLRSDISRVGWK
jgi:hypothetical protein